MCVYISVGVCEKGVAIERDSKAFCWCLLFWEGMTETAEQWSWNFNFGSVGNGQKEPSV